MKKEAEIVLNKFNIKLNTATRIENEDKIVLVDTNLLDWNSKSHRKGKYSWNNRSS